MYEDYRPVPIDTSGIVLSEDMIGLIEKIAIDQHEIHAKMFFDAGWKFGDSRDARKHLHPLLMPYDELTDEQKAHYVNTVASVIKAIIALGYKISQ